MKSDVELKIHFAWGPVAAFSLNYDNYYHRSLPIPQIFDTNLIPQLIPNLDGWFQAKTHQRHSYRGFLDMVEAFGWGLQHTYSLTDLESICGRAATAAKSFILTQKMGDFAKLFWVEVLDPAKLEHYADSIRERFKQLRKSLGDDQFYNNLCRLWKFSAHNRPKMAPIFEKFIQRLGRIAADPTYPTTPELDSELQKSVLSTVLERRAVAYKGVSEDTQAKVGALLHVSRSQAVKT